MKPDTEKLMLNNRIPAVIFVLFMVFTLLLPKPAFAAENEPPDEIVNSFDDKKPEVSENTMRDVLEGFDDDTKEAEPELPKDEIKPSVFSLNGDVKLGASYNFAHDKPEGNETDWRGLSRLRTKLNMELNARFSSSWQASISGKGAYDFAYAIRGRDEFTDEMIDNYEKELELGETYIQGSLTKSLDVKIGRQIVVWGKSDNIRVTDVLNPLDIREPGLTDIEDLRLPITMSRLDYYIGDWSLTGIAIHEIRFNKIPEYGSDFYPGSQPPPHEDKPNSCCKNTEYAAAINGILSGWDIAFYWADFYNDMPDTQLVSAGPPPQIEWKHARLKMFGAAFNAAVGNWLLKTETAYIDGFEFFNSPGREYSRTDVLAGVEYSGFKDTTLSIEAANRHINDFDEALKLPPDNARKDEFQWAVRLTRDFLNDTLTLTLLASTFGEAGQNGALQRFSAEYDVTDSIQITGGVVFYKSGDLARYKNIGEKISVVIWTTTPWTLPANLAIALHEDFDYVAVKVEGEVLIFAKDLQDYCLDTFGFREKEYEVLDEFKGSALKGLKCRHPFIERDSVLILAPFVTLEAGTGCVHIAPGHGQEDYEIGLEYGLDVYAPVDDEGRFTPNVDFFAGQFVFDANDAVTEKLREVEALLSTMDMEHQYPHCWRCKKPIIFRSTEQWFISMEKNGLREKALKAIDSVNWFPSWGRDRIYGMIENRPDWCISRQRSWGVPITVFYCKNCGNYLATEEMLDHVVALVREHGADIWFEKDAHDLLPDGVVCPTCDGTDFKKETNILDVWFDSGVSHAAVLEKRDDLGSPCDMYLEGSDQHRGWFHSSLLESVGTRGRAPYRNVLTHGFVVDGEGKKMSKSLGNFIDPQKMVDQYGAEILRLWVAAEDYTSDIRISDEILKRLVEAYRRIRNTSRYILGNLYDFDCKKDMVSVEDMEEIDRWALHRLQEIVRRVRNAYESYQFHVVYYTLYNFCSVDLSALYLDVLKDRLYTSKAGARERRSAQSAMYIILDAMTRLLTPVLVFTSEEIWSNMPDYDGKEESVHMAQFPEIDSQYLDEDLGKKWETLIAVKGEVSKAIEIARQKKVVGHSLDSCVNIHAPEGLQAFLEGYIDNMRALLIVSQINLVPADKISDSDPYESTEFEGLKIEVSRARGLKCERCWNYSETVGENADHPTICVRCVKNL